MSDLIASARSMTTYSEGQYNAVGFPKGGLTPATITAMVGFSQGQGLQMNPMVSAALDKIKGGTTSILNGVPGLESALANANVSTSSLTTSSNVAATIETIKTAANVDGITIDSATETSLTSSITVASKLESLSSKLMAGGPAAFMQKFNAARGHIADSIEIKKVTAFTANQSLDSFGSGMKSISSLSSNGLGGVMGNMAAAGAAMAAAGPLFNLNDVKNLGSPVGLVKKLASSKMANATGVNAELTKAGVDIDDLENPAYADKISKVMNNISDPKILKDVADQFDIKPPGGLPEVGKQSFADANPFAGIPGYTGEDSSLNTNAGAALLGGGPPPAPVQPSIAESSANPIRWADNNNLSVAPAVDSSLVAIENQLKDLLDEFFAQSTKINDTFTAFTDELYALDFGKAGVEAERVAISAKYNKLLPRSELNTLIDQATELARLTNTLPRSSALFRKWAKMSLYWNQTTEITRSRVDDLKKITNEIKAKIAAAGGS